MGAKPQTEQSRNQRAKTRCAVRIPVKVRRPGETWHSSLIADLSLTGFRLQSFMKLASGTDLWIMLPGFEGRRAKVTWSRAHESGCLFEHPLHPAIFDHIIRISQQPL